MLTLTDHMLLKVTGGFSIEHLLLFRRPRIVEIQETKEQKQSQLKQQQQQKLMQLISFFGLIQCSL